MRITDEELVQIKEQIRYEPETGEFFYTANRFIERKFDPARPMAVRRPPKLAHSEGQRADKEYSGTYIGVYVLGRVFNAAHMALFFINGAWPEAVQYKDHTWDNLAASNLVAITKSEQATKAASARYEGSERKLPPNIYVCSNGEFIARKGKLRTKQYESVREAVQALNKGRWI